MKKKFNEIPGVIYTYSLNQFIKKEKGITLIALVITIIVLLILSGITIQSITHTGIFDNAKQAELQNKRAQIIEYLKLKLINEQTNNPFGSAEEIITATRNNVIENIEDLKKIGKEVTVEETSTEEDGENVDIYFYVIVDKDVYKVELDDVTFIGELGKFPPVIKLKSISNTTNTITVEVTTKRNQGGILEYYIKSEDEEEYKLIKTTTEEKYTYEGLTQNKKYSIKVIAVAENKKTAEVIAEQTTGKIVDLTEANAKFTYSTNDWTNTDVKATASTDITGYTIQTSLDGKNWNSTASQTLTANGNVYARLWDGINAGGMLTGTVTNIDKLKPNTFTPTTTSSINSITVTSSTTDQAKTTDNGSSGISGYRFSKDGGTTWTEYQTSGTYKFNDMLKDINGSTYNIVVQAIDKAKNVTTSTVVKATTTKNMNYYTNEADKILCKVTSGDKTFSREYYKYNNEGAIVATSYCRGMCNTGTGISDNTLMYPLLVSTSKSAVSYYCGENGIKTNKSGELICEGVIEYKGVKYYYSSGGWWYQIVQGYTYTSSVKSLNTSSKPFNENLDIKEGLKSSALTLIKLYLGE